MPELINERDLATLKDIRADCANLAARIGDMANNGFIIAFSIADGELAHFQVTRNVRIDMGDA